MATKLGLYNAALRTIGEIKLASLSENREPRRVLDDVYDDAVAACLEQGQWNFAIRTVSVEADESVDTDFGYAYAFSKPVDWVRTTALSADEYLRIPLTEYADRKGYWLADIAPLYVGYVSNDDDFGLDLGSWPQSFTKFVELYLANEIVTRLTQGKSDGEMIRRDLKVAKRDALSKDAMNDPVKFLPQGSWVTARTGGQWRGRRYQRG